MSPIIKAPFNFVPLNKDVFYPDWADEISHDIPFEDGFSGTIELDIEAQTPIYVRNGVQSSKQNTEDGDYLKFSNIDGRYFIPGSSIKGMIRNVMEIMSFGKMPVDGRKKYAQREWSNSKLYTLKDIKVQNTIRCGFLKKKDEDGYELYDCGQPYRINHIRLDEYLNKKDIDSLFRNHFSRKNGKILNKSISIGKENYDPKSARFKYELLRSKNFTLPDKLRFSIDGEYANQNQCRRVEYNPQGDIEGTIVFTGQPDSWKEPRDIGTGKFYEFVFPVSNDDPIKVDAKEVEQFKFIYENSEDWKVWRRKLEDGEKIPVFFRKEKNRVKDFGFALLYKLPYENSVEDVVRGYQKFEDKFDLAECIFGSSLKDNSLKGRVQVGNAFVEGEQRTLPEVKVVLGSPKASYYPLYIQQSGKNGKTDKYLTYNDGVISGWKRYPVKNFAKPKWSEIESVNTKFIPLGKDTRLKTVIRFHNLKKEELGALLSAITFHGNQERLFHNIGMAKSMGYGKVKVNCSLIGELKGQEEIMMGYYEKLMDGKCNNWLSSYQIKELFAMADANHGLDTYLEYMNLEMKGKNEFEAAKVGKEYLQPFSQLTKSTNKFTVSLYSKHQNTIDAEIIRKEKEKKEVQAVQARADEEKRKADEAARKAEEESERQAKREEMTSIGPQIADIDDFKNGSGRLDTYVKKVDLKEEFYPVVFDFLVRCYNNPKNKDSKKWQAPFGDTNHIFKKIASWVGTEMAQQWYNQIIVGGK